MLLLDTNAILRFVLQDNNKMSDEVEDILLSRTDIVVPLEVVAEMVYVLSKVYRMSRKEIVNKITKISDLGLILEKEVVLYGINLFASAKLDFVDCLLAAYSKIKGHEVFTFDKELKKQLV
ncbi:MAG: PIN domain-containing protein [Candidatus Margulisbacteria bacterium]|jgi:predicted nucleic-acid-binding protein|nr:PIN domain-containing protein [Candidatus Margulisiibacteriota bacterium]